MGQIANRQSLAIFDRRLKLQPFAQFWRIGLLNYESPLARKEILRKMGGWKRVKVSPSCGMDSGSLLRNPKSHIATEPLRFQQIHILVNVESLSLDMSHVSVCPGVPRLLKF